MSDDTPEPNDMYYNGLTATQYETLMKPLNGIRVAKRSQGGKQLSYLEAWDVRAHLIRVFGFTGFDCEMLSSDLMFAREYKSGDRTMFEIAYKVVMRLTIKDQNGLPIAVYSEGAVGSASGGTGIGDLHDNALKSAASDAMKRCAINLGTQFGLSLYDEGSTREIVKGTIVKPSGVAPKPDLTDEQKDMLKNSLGATEVEKVDA